jgi:hypothetical protein
LLFSKKQALESSDNMQHDRGGIDKVEQSEVDALKERMEKRKATQENQ